MRRLLVALAIVIAFMATGNAGAVGVAAQSPTTALFVTLPMTHGFADATDDLVETQALVHDALAAVETVRLVDRLQDSDAVLTVIGRGTGYDELTAALAEVNRDVVVTPVLLHARERYIEAMITVGSCGEAGTNAWSESNSASCYRKVFIGLGDHNVPQGVPKAAQNTWVICADAVARDVQAWIAQNATRLLARR
ncbi:MAG TPA: hypothetical protein VFU28_13410 [Vicinamibacterales bacterium]|nr:hypothetical protein [Vicinamibacterales bacterium]